MSTFIGTEYIIATLMLVIYKKNNQKEISLETIMEFVRHLQKTSCKYNLDHIFLCDHSRIINFLCDYPEYFSFDNKKSTIKINEYKDYKDLEAKFIGYLPFYTTMFLYTEANNFVTNNKKG